ncbi:MAG TPA: hypothetical protein VG916_12070 [Gemmatimonadaceae bacterium]|nr:hypothetical protein [Gemmatimonadaceae bacterium]
MAAHVVALADLTPSAGTPLPGDVLTPGTRTTAPEPPPPKA